MLTEVAVKSETFFFKFEKRKKRKRPFLVGVIVCFKIRGKKNAFFLFPLHYRMSTFSYGARKEVYPIHNGVPFLLCFKMNGCSHIVLHTTHVRNLTH